MTTEAAPAATLSDADAQAVLVDLVSTPSVSGDEGAAAALLVARMRELGFDEAFVDEAGNPVGIKGRGARQLVFLGHVDTVPGEVPIRIEDGQLYGRGSVDAKGPLASFVCGVARATVAPEWSVIVVGAVEEEAPSSKGARFAKDQYAPELCVIGEPSDWDAVTLGYKGRLLVDFSLRHAIGHSAGPEQSAAELGCAFWAAILAGAEELNAGEQTLFGRLDPSLLEINTQDDGLFQTVKLTASFRTPLGFEREAWEARLRAAAPAGAELAFYGGEVAYRGGKSNALVRAFLRGIRAEGGTPRFKVKTGTADMNVVGPQWGCPILAYGPGDSKLDHTPDEHVPLEDFQRAVRVVTRVVEQVTAPGAR
ncbi:MAG: [LysW]-lysine hydrolase [Planctomycetes bacterium]|nr:[LysW]-lysine hydrolase [Planctomycetota bacterium]